MRESKRGAEEAQRLDMEVYAGWCWCTGGSRRSTLLVSFDPVWWYFLEDEDWGKRIVEMGSSLQLMGWVVDFDTIGFIFGFLFEEREILPWALNDGFNEEGKGDRFFFRFFKTMVISFVHHYH